MPHDLPETLFPRSLALFGAFVPYAAPSWLEWTDRLALALVCREYAAAVRHPYLDMAAQHHRCADGGQPLPLAVASQMLLGARRLGTELVEVAIMQNRSALLQLSSPTYPELLDLRTEGFLHHARARFWRGVSERRAHEQVLSALRSSQFALTYASTQYACVVSRMADLDVADYNSHLTLVSCNHALTLDEQAAEIAMRTRMPSGYTYIFACALVYTRLACVKQMEMADSSSASTGDD